MRPKRRRLRQFWILAHRYVGLAIGVFIAVNGLAGSVLVFEPEILRRLYPELMTVEPRGAHEPLSEIAAAAVAASGGGRILYLRYPFAPTEPFEVEVAPPHEPGSVTLLVDPYTAAVLGHRPDAMMDFLFDLHTELLAGEAGEIAVGILGLLLLATCGSGLLLWWPRPGTWRRALTIAWRAPWRRKTWDLHRVTGATAAVLLIVAALTGSGIIFREAISAAAVGIGAVPFSSPVPPSSPIPGSAASLDAIVQEAERRFDGAKITYVTMPSGAEGAYRIRMRFPTEIHQNGRSYIWFDPHDGRVVMARSALAMPAVNTALDHALYPLHTGVALGLPGRLLVFLTGLTPTVLIVTGVVIWHVKRRARRRQKGN